jgi:hypothetical protein
VVLEAKRLDRCDLRARDVNDGNGIVLLQRDPGRLAVFADGDVFRLEVLRRRGLGAKDADALRAQRRFLAIEAAEVGGGDAWVMMLTAPSGSLVPATP